MAKICSCLFPLQACICVVSAGSPAVLTLADRSTPSPSWLFYGLFVLVHRGTP
uniref:Uncharacterized protein n=1 Tax=Zea mays TaxID=4577 RepID=B6UFB1_MAIZE|nr:hypothetical protein [Zea mays]